MGERSEGELVEWDDDRGFGFIRADGGSRFFVHIKSIRRIVNRPRIGDRLHFEIGAGRDGRPAAIDAVIAGANPLQYQNRPGRRAAISAPPDLRAALRIVVALALLSLVTAAVLTGRLPAALAAIYLGMGTVSIAAYWFDKSAAETGRWRVPEYRLHLIDFAAGIAGGLFAQALLRHKTSKPDFALVTAAIVTIHIVGLALLIAGIIDLP